MALPLLIILLAGSVAGGIWRYRKSHGNRLQRALEAMVPLCAGGAIYMLIGRIAFSLPLDWNEGKMAPIVAMTYGYSLYQNPDNGVMTGWLYGPVAALLLLPAAVASDPTTVVLIGVLITTAFYMTPAIWLLAQASAGHARGLAVICALIFLWQTVYKEDLIRCVAVAGADGVALGLACFSGAVIYRNRSIAGMIVSSLCAVLCVWTKQNFLPLLAALPLYIAIVDGAKQAGIYLAILAGWALLVSAALIGAFGGPEMYFHMIALPASHPLKDAQAGKLLAIYRVLADLLVWCGFALQLLLLAILLSFLIRPDESAGGARQWLKARPWSLPVIIGLFLVPAAVIPYAKAGGFVNNLACVNYFLLLGALAGILQTCRLASAPAALTLSGFVRALMILQALLLMVNCMLSASNNAETVWKSIDHPYRNQQQVVFRYAKAYPQTIYCPWNPLTTLLADGKLYHFEWGILDRRYADHRPPAEQLARPLPSPAHFAAHLPARMSAIVYCSEPQSAVAQQFLPQFRYRVQRDELPGCVVYIK